MKKTTKGALAAGSAAVLLMGGAGTMAFWTAEGTVSGTEIKTGHLTLDASDCQGTGGWELEGDAFDPATDTLVPGDTLTKECDVEIDVQGTHFTQVDIEATTPTSIAGAGWDEVDVAATVQGTANGANNVGVTQGTNNIPVAITVTWDYGVEDNDLNGNFTAQLGDIVITAIQNHKTD